MQLNVKKFECYLTQSPQKNPVQFAFVNHTFSGVYENIMPFVMCRDYFNEIIWAQWKQKSSQNVIKTRVYGFDWNASTQHFTEDRVELAVEIPEKNNNLENNLHRLHEIETKNGFDVTVLHCVSPKHYILFADKKWQSTTQLFALYTLLLREFCSNESKEWKEPLIVNKMQRCWTDPNGLTVSVFEKIIADLSILSVPEGSDPSGSERDDQDYIHNYGGILSVVHLIRCKVKFEHPNKERFLELVEKEEKDAYNALFGMQCAA